jgi:hypothetical protein
MTRFGVALAGALVVLMVACSSAPTFTAATPTVTPTTSPTLTKPVATTPDPLPPPTYVRWAVDKSGFADRPYFLDFFYDGIATSFRVLDTSGQVVLRVPIAGSGVFGPETCAVRARPAGKAEGHTYVVLDADALQQFTANASSYRVEADSVGGRTVTVGLSDTGCRAA